MDEVAVEEDEDEDTVLHTDAVEAVKLGSRRNFTQ